MKKLRLSLRDILKGVEHGFKIGKRKRVMIVPGNNGDTPKLAYELEKRGYDYYISSRYCTPDDSYEIDLREINII